MSPMAYASPRVVGKPRTPSPTPTADTILPPGVTSISLTTLPLLTPYSPSTISSPLPVPSTGDLDSSLSTTVTATTTTWRTQYMTRTSTSYMTLTSELPAPRLSPPPRPQKSPAMPIAGSVLGGVTALALLLVLLACLQRRRRRRSLYMVMPYDSDVFRQQDEDLEGAPMLPPMEERNAGSSTILLPPPKRARRAGNVASQTYTPSQVPQGAAPLAGSRENVTPPVPPNPEPGHAQPVDPQGGQVVGDGWRYIPTTSPINETVEGLRTEVTNLTREVTRVQTVLQRLRSYINLAQQVAVRPQTPRDRRTTRGSSLFTTLHTPPPQYSSSPIAVVSRY